ncbi:PaaI family thioesterase [Shewanella nanhaiensis]|uniref:PaaI family thioesterase n=1 Tax=Shewanella nanhaiensis TaxID=2864872 RepID=A0ABS7E1J9_9GAMM|nr:PaaI family thioesterase [Shewanella nanhaiensis]MBW8183524.1 PaaI family thioesterase [Shewanella nanhaiensis]
MTPVISDYAKQLSDNLILHSYQKYCGLKIVHQEAGYCKCELVVTEAIDNLSHTLHGGVIYSMLDVTSMLATIPALEDGEYALTSSFNTSLMSASTLGQTVEFEAKITRNGRNLIFTECHAFKIEPSGERKKVACAQLTKFRLKQQLE